MGPRAKKTESKLFIGISGWTYAGWRGVFYPPDLAHKRELEYASRQLNSIEINGSFYRLQRPESYLRWREETPEGFVFAVKGGRFITHMKKLLDVRVALANFLASGVLRLEDKLGPILWQFPERMRYDAVRFAEFLEMLPRTTREAAALAEESTLAADRAWTDAGPERRLRHVFEPRHPEFFTAEFASLLRGHGAGLVLADTAGKWPYAEEITADFVYIRLHGAEELYTSGYSDEQLDWWAERIRLWRAGREPPDALRLTDEEPPGSRGRDVYVYFDNDAKVHAPADARRLVERLGGTASVASRA